MTDDRMRKQGRSSAADAQYSRVLTFDGFDPQDYGGFVWNHFQYDGTGIPPTSTGSGGAMAENAWAQGSSFASTDGLFNVASLQLIAELEDLTVKIFGFSAGKPIYVQAVRITTSHVSEVQLNWQGVDAVYFDVDPSGTRHPGALYFRMDDLAVSNVGGAISGSVIFDRNADGAVDAGETGLKGRTVILDDNGNGAVDAGERFTTTDRNGAYHFAGVLDGDHTVTQILPPDWAQSGVAGPVGVSVVDSGAATADLFSGPARDVLGTVSGLVFHDTDLDGAHGRGETPLAGWTVYIDADGDGVHDAGERAVMTDANGRYRFDAVAPGEVAIRADLPASWQHWSAGGESATVSAGTRTPGVDIAVAGGATAGDDQLVAVGGSADTIEALAGNDRVIARGGDDRVDGGAGDDVLGGGYGADWLFGGAGNDRLIGGGGADVFVIDGAGTDRIADFAAGDHIRITASGVDAFSDLTITAHGDATAIGWAGTEVAVLVRGIAPGALDPSMFVFGG